MRVGVGAIAASRTLKLAEYALTMVGALALGCLAVFLEAKFYQARESRDFARELRLKERNKAAPVDSLAAVATPDKHGVVGRLEIPRLGVSVMVVEGVDDSDLNLAVGHIPGPRCHGNRGMSDLPGTETRFSGLSARSSGTIRSPCALSTERTAIA
jgi:sortase (surface protein transpeptidase)